MIFRKSTEALAANSTICWSDSEAPKREPGRLSSIFISKLICHMTARMSVLGGLRSIENRTTNGLRKHPTLYLQEDQVP